MPIGSLPRERFVEVLGLIIEVHVAFPKHFPKIPIDERCALGRDGGALKIWRNY